MPRGNLRSPRPADGVTPVAPVISRVARRRAKRRRRRRQLAGVVCLVGLSGLAGAVLVIRPAGPARRSAHSSKSTSTTSTILAATQPVTSTSGDLFDEPSVASYLAGSTYDVTAAVYDAVTGTTSLYRPTVAETTASIMKVDILTTLLAQDQADGATLTPTEQDLSGDMIEQSDNDDAQHLWDGEGGARAIDSFDAAAGLTQTDPDAAGYWGLSTTTAADQMRLMRVVAYPNDVLTPASRHYALDLMSHIEPGQAWGVSAGAAPNATVALKNGWLPLDDGGWQVNSVGYVDGDGRNYTIAVLSDGATEAGGIAAIQGLSELIWQELAPLRS
jgi:Beta-lactamase enzyme family